MVMKRKIILYLIFIINTFFLISCEQKQNQNQQLPSNWEVTQYGDTIIHNEDGTISIPMENGDFISMTEQHYWDSRKKMQEYNEQHRNDPHDKKTKVVRIKQRVSASAWVDAGDLRSDPYDETEIVTDVIVEDNDNDWHP
jgi:hypothetical protein